MPALPLFFLPLLLAPVTLHAETCETLLAQIDAKIRAGGATNFTLMTVDADATDPGRVIGSCGMGRKKILYTAVGGGGSARSTMPAGATMSNPSGIARARPTVAVLTECKDGYTGSDCSQRRVAAPAVDLKKAVP